MKCLFRVCVMLLSGLWATSGAALTLNNLVDVQGIRSNQLIGYSLVIGLDGSGDKNQVKFTSQSTTNMLRQFGVQLPEKFDPKVKNVAAVMVTGTLPPMYARGQSIDITVSSIGDAKSLRGGTLLLTQLRGADGEVYALAQGQVVVGGVSAEGRSGSNVTVNLPTVGRIPNGATIEQEIPTDFFDKETITLNIKRPNFSTANNITTSINKKFGQGTASAQGLTNIVVKAPKNANQRVTFMANLLALDVTPGKQVARIVFNAKTGTIVIGGDVAVYPAAVTHGNLTVTIKEETKVSQPNALARGRTSETPKSEVKLEQDKQKMVLLPRSTTLKQVVETINRLGAGPDDIMAILQALHEAGALDAELVVI